MIKIFIAEDESLELEYLTYIINKNKNMKVVGTCNNGRDAVKLTKQLNPDLVIMDISMPLQNGVEAGKLIKRYNPDIKIILNSAYSEFQYAKQAIKYGFNDYLLKPTEESKIINTIENLFDFNNDSKSILSNSTEDRFKLVETIDLFNENLINNNLSAGLEIVESLSLLIANQINHRAKMTYIDHFLLSIETTLRNIKNTKYNIFGHLSSFLEDDLTFSNINKSLKKICIESFNIRSEETFSITIIKNFIENNFSNPEIGLNEISNIFFVNKTYLSRVFKQEENITVDSYIELLRLDRALELIDTTDLKISDIWNLSGFKNKQQFYRSFNSRFKMTPMERREKNDKFNK